MSESSPDPTDDHPPATENPDLNARWLAEIQVDPLWYADQDSEEPCPAVGPPTLVPLISNRLLIGRTSTSRDVHPDIDCSDDVGVSREQARLTTDGTRWWVEDLHSANGTYLGPATHPAQDDPPTPAPAETTAPETAPGMTELTEVNAHPITPGQRQELAADDCIYIGAWTRITVRPTTSSDNIPCEDPSQHAANSHDTANDHSDATEPDTEKPE